MLTPRGVSLALAGVGMWFVAKLVGSPGLEVAGIGLAVVPFLAALTVRARTLQTLAVRRRLSDTRVTPGTRLRVGLEVENLAVAPAPMLLREDVLPSALGRPARLVVTDLRGRSRREVAYTLLPQARGVYRVGPLTVDATDAFGVSRRRLRLEGHDELIVTPEVEDLTTPPDAASGRGSGAARARQLLRSGDDYFTMRAYQEGDDLRRIHWPSVARTGQLMIRQDETSKRAVGLLFLDNREAGLGREHTAAFERAVSAVASVGTLLTRAGFTLKVATSERAATALDGDGFLDALAATGSTRVASLATSITALRGAAAADTSLVFVGAPPSSQELPALIRGTAGFGPRLAILIHPVDPLSAPPSRREQMHARATHASLTLARGGWDCLVMSPTTRLAERWHRPREHQLASSA
jgi:uncharacterized protein (DUF58 family)